MCLWGGGRVRGGGRRSLVQWWVDGNLLSPSGTGSYFQCFVGFISEGEGEGVGER